MVQADGCHDRDCWSYDVGAVEPATEPYFNDGSIYFPAGEPPQCHSGRNLEKRKAFEDGLVIFEKFPDFLPGNHLISVCPYDFHPFPEVQQVGRCVETDHALVALPVRLLLHTSSSCQCRSQHAAHAALSVSPRHVDAGILLPGVSQCRIQALHPLQTRFICIAGEPCCLYRAETLEQSGNPFLIRCRIKTLAHIPQN